MPSTKHNAPNQIAKGDIRSSWNRPTVGNSVICCRPHKVRNAQINRNRTNHTAQSCKERCRRLFAAQTAVFQCDSFPNFFGSNGKEEGHQNIIDQVVQGQRAMPVMIVPDWSVIPNLEFNKIVVTLIVDIRPN